MNHTKCILCNGTKLHSLDEFKECGLVKCDSCSFVFSKFIPSKKDLIDYYSGNYDRTSYFSPITRKRYEELLDKFESYRRTNKILDIGCGYGFFLEVAKERGWEVYGVEITQKAVDTCEEKGINMFMGDISEVSFDEDSFDVVVSIEVIEHLNDPNTFLSKSYSLLRKGGLMYVTTPNFNSYLRHQLKADYDVICYPNHLSYFSVKTLKRAFVQNGFKKQKIKTTGMSVTRVKTSKGKSQQEFVSETSDDEMIRYRIEKNVFLRAMKNVINSTLSILRIGHNIKGYFIKP